MCMFRHQSVFLDIDAHRYTEENNCPMIQAVSRDMEPHIMFSVGTVVSEGQWGLSCPPHSQVLRATFKPLDYAVVLECS